MHSISRAYSVQNLSIQNQFSSKNTVSRKMKCYKIFGKSYIIIKSDYFFSSSDFDLL
jgi:hypothetical protein